MVGFEITNKLFFPCDNKMRSQNKMCDHNLETLLVNRLVFRRGLVNFQTDIPSLKVKCTEILNKTIRQAKEYSVDSQEFNVDIHYDQPFQS